MPDYELLIHLGGDRPPIGVADGKIAAFARGSARAEFDASGLLVLPGAIDAHVHFNEPGRTDWEGIASGSRACAAGGTTVFFDMPLNSSPPVCDAASFALKRQAMECHSRVDFAIWGGLVPGNADRLEQLGNLGVVGFKAFMSNSGIQDFPKADARTLKEGMKRAAELGLIVAVHAEIDHPELQKGTTARDYLASRPISMEVEAIKLALDLAGETGCKLHVVHVSSAEGAALIASARHKVDVSSETCPHYLTLTGEDLERLGPIAKCAPPLRSETERQALAEAVKRGDIDTIGSDHSPSPMSMKEDADFFKVWGGISGCQHMLALLFDLGLEPELIARLTAAAPASRFGLPAKGTIEIGADADLVFIAPDETTAVHADALEYKHRHSPYVGRTLRGRVKTVMSRGRKVFSDGRVIDELKGRLLIPQL